MGLFYRFFDRDYRDYRKQTRVFRRKLRKSVRKANLFDHDELHHMVEIWVNSMYEYYKRGANVWQNGIGSQTIIDQLAEVKAMFDEIHQLYNDWWVSLRANVIGPGEKFPILSDEEEAAIEAKWNREHELYRLIYAKIGEYIEGWWD